MKETTDRSFIPTHPRDILGKNYERVQISPIYIQFLEINCIYGIYGSLKRWWVTATAGAQGRFTREKKGRFFAASPAANKGINYFWQIASTMRDKKTYELFRKLENGADSVVKESGASERLHKQTR